MKQTVRLNMNLLSCKNIPSYNATTLKIYPGLKVLIAADKKEFIYKRKVNPIHTILKYGDYHNFLDR